MFLFQIPTIHFFELDHKSERLFREDDETFSESGLSLEVRHLKVSSSVSCTLT